MAFRMIISSLPAAASNSDCRRHSHPDCRATFIGTNEPLRLPRAPSLSLTGVRLVIPDHALGSPVLRSLSLCTCCRHYPVFAAGRITSLIHPVVLAFPVRVTGSVCDLLFSRLAWCLFALR